jgi:hypothetical protein
LAFPRPRCDNRVGGACRVRHTPVEERGNQHTDHTKSHVHLHPLDDVRDVLTPPSMLMHTDNTRGAHSAYSLGLWAVWSTPAQVIGRSLAYTGAPALSIPSCSPIMSRPVYIHTLSCQHTPLLHVVSLYLAHHASLLCLFSTSMHAHLHALRAHLYPPPCTPQLPLTPSPTRPAPPPPPWHESPPLPGHHPCPHHCPCPYQYPA